MVRLAFLRFLRAGACRRPRVAGTFRPRRTHLLHPTSPGLQPVISRAQLPLTHRLLVAAGVRRRELLGPWLRVVGLSVLGTLSRAAMTASRPRRQHSRGHNLARIRRREISCWRLATVTTAAVWWPPAKMPWVCQIIGVGKCFCGSKPIATAMSLPSTLTSTATWWPRMTKPQLVLGLAIQLGLLPPVH